MALTFILEGPHGRTVRLGMLDSARLARFGKTVGAFSSDHDDPSLIPYFTLSSRQPRILTPAQCKGTLDVLTSRTDLPDAAVQLEGLLRLAVKVRRPLTCRR